MAAQIWDCKKQVIPFIAMAAMECINVGLNTLYKAASTKGLSYFVFVTYSYAFGSITLLPLLFIFPRRGGLPPFTTSIFYRIVLLSVIGFGGNMCIFKGIEYSSPTLATAMSNLSPAFTFVLAVIFRMETLDFRRSSTIAKTIGTLLSISGALIAILYKGTKIFSSPSKETPFSVFDYSLRTSQPNWVLGGLLLVAFCVLVSIWYILQTQLIKEYPAELIVVVLYSLCTAIVGAVVSFMVGTDINDWTLRTDKALVTIILYGFLGPSFSAAVHTWGLLLKGPVYVSIFKPFSIVIAAVMGVIFLGDALYIGSVIGATILLFGLYAVVWGKAKEETSKDCASKDLETSTENKTPLLRTMAAAECSMFSTRAQQLYHLNSQSAPVKSVLQSHSLDLQKPLSNWALGGFLVATEFLLNSIISKREKRRGQRERDRKMVGERYCYRDVLPFSAMVTMECINVGLNTLFKAATLRGMSYHVFVVYAYAVAALVLLPAPFISTRSSSQIMGFTGINYSSPTLASAISNLVPAFTFILAIIFRMEKVALKSTSSQAKMLGTIVSIGGAFVATLYQGPPIIRAPYTNVSLHNYQNQSSSTLHDQNSSNSNWVIGGLLLTAEYILVPLWYIVQTQIMKEYPNELTVVFFYNLYVSIFAGIVGLVMETDSNAWKLKPGIALASVLCSGVFGSFLNNTVHTWALHLKGPVYVAMFKPLSIAIAAAMTFIFLGDSLHLGSVIGATMISIGFYTVMWGKAKEEDVNEEIEEYHRVEGLESPPIDKTPLLQSYKMDKK
ncbi:hypothetical protein G4B88_015536 [Cannabis sativa]|uniref:EamA domain-containing protein n=1 Tax=Cannabis sativa TaxID=3483 RepID=A0A7J6H5S4_CANSA|nr:hypothetical protein G4B88_015536 [Cannabis sativa]